jgi:hypothetical protein
MAATCPTQGGAASTTAGYVDSLTYCLPGNQRVLALFHLLWRSRPEVVVSAHFVNDGFMLTKDAPDVNG